MDSSSNLLFGTQPLSPNQVSEFIYKIPAFLSESLELGSSFENLHAYMLQEPGSQTPKYSHENQELFILSWLLANHLF